MLISSTFYVTSKGVNEKFITRSQTTCPYMAMPAFTVRSAQFTLDAVDALPRFPVMVVEEWLIKHRDCALQG
jgi:hypothetical protein